MNKVKGKVVTIFGTVPFRKGEDVVIDLENGIPEFGLKIEKFDEERKSIKLVGNGNVLKVKF